MLSLASTCHTPAGWRAPLPAALDGPRTLVLAFGGRGVPSSAALQELAAAFPASAIVGCSTAGEIDGMSVTDDSLTVAACRFARTDIRVTCAAVSCPGDSMRAGAQIGQDLAAADLRSVLLFSDGLVVNGSALVDGVNAHLGPDVVVTGGLAADGPRFERTWTIHDGIVRTGIVSAVGLYGAAVHVGHGSRGGWDVFGVERRITRASHNVLYELDHRPALGLYRTYLGELAAGLPATALLFPLLVRLPGAEERALVRTVLAVSDGEQSMTFAGDVPEGAYASLMRANCDRLIEGASAAGRLAGGAVPAAGPTLVLAISCVGRRLVLGDRADEELEAVAEALPPQATMVGFYSYGEIAPFARGRADLHNQTMTLTSVWEA